MRPERQKRKKLDNLRKELKKIKHQNIISQAEDNLHPEAQCSQHNCPVQRAVDKIDILEQQFDEAESEILRIEDIFKSDNDKCDDGAVFEIAKLPEVLIMEVFKRLNLDDLCRVGRVCKTWHEMTRCQVFWKKIQANIEECSLCIPEATFQLISILPSFVTSISLNFNHSGFWHIEFNKFAKELREKCPNLQILVLNRISFQIDTDELVQLCTELPKDIRVLSLPNCNFYLRGYREESEDCISNIEVLDLSECSRPICSRYSLTHMPNLKKLHLPGCDFLHDEFFEPIGSVIDQLQVLDLERTLTYSITFQTIINHSQHLTELYVCWTPVEDSDLIFIKEQNGFPCLKIICLRGCDVTTIGVFSLIKSCSSLQKIFVGSNELMPENASWGSEIVEDLGSGYCNHSKKSGFYV